LKWGVLNPPFERNREGGRAGGGCLGIWY